MKRIKICLIAIALICTTVALSGCESFYQMFIDESDVSSGVYSAVYDTEYEGTIPDTPFIKGNPHDVISTYGLTLEATLAYDLETSNEATLSFFYYHNSENEDAADYCKIGLSCMGTYEGDAEKVIFTFEKDGYNTAFARFGSDFADSDIFRGCSFNADGSCGVWAYASVPWDYEDIAVIDENVVKDLPDSIIVTLSGNRITGWSVSD